jgi:hypothetical protein
MPVAVDGLDNVKPRPYAGIPITSLSLGVPRDTQYSADQFYRRIFHTISKANFQNIKTLQLRRTTSYFSFVANIKVEIVLSSNERT